MTGTTLGRMHSSQSCARARWRTLVVALSLPFLLDPYFHACTSSRDFLLPCARKRFQVVEALLAVVVEQVEVERTGVMHQLIAQIAQDLQAKRQGLWDNLLGSDNAEQFMVAFWTP